MQIFKITAGHYFTGQRITRQFAASSEAAARMRVSSWFNDGDFAIISIEMCLE